MDTDTHSTLPPAMRDFAHHTRRFAEGLKLLSFDDDSDIGVATAADRLAVSVDALTDRLLQPAKQGVDAKLGDMLGEAAARLAPAVETFGGLVGTFRQDAASGATSLPDMDDIAVAAGLLGQSQAQLMRLLDLVPAAAGNLPSPERAELVECLTSVGLPLADVGLHPPTMIKIIILIVIVLVYRERSDARALVIIIVNVLVVIDRRAQGGFKLPGSGTPPSGTPPTGTPPTGTPPTGTPPPPADPCAAKGEFPLIVGGTGADDAEALADATRNATIIAAGRCGSGCRPRIVRLSNEFVRTGGENGAPVRLARRFIFRCV